jgi:uncharacterized membrane protein YbhN (UPF0104 family)
VSLAVRLIAGVVVLAVAALTVASLALARVVPGWGVLFFYVLPTLFFAFWSARELSPARWRRATAPVRRSWRLSPLAGPRRAPPVPAPPPRPARAELGTTLGATVLAEAARGWLLVIRAALATLRTPGVRRVFNAVFVAGAAAMIFFVVREVADRGWPLGHANAAPTAAAVAFFLSTFALRAVGWQLLFRPYERPRSLALVASNGTAAVAALALPSRVDDAIAIAVLRRLSPRAPSVGTLALSLFLLGLMDMAALTPFAALAAVSAETGYAVRVTMAALTGVGVGAGLLAAALPRVRGSERIVRFRLGHWLALHAPSSHRDAIWSWLLVAGSWLTRAAGLYVLLDAVGLNAPFAVATAYVVAGAGAAALPVGPAGAATQAGVGAAVLAGAGIAARDAVAFAVAAQSLTIVAGALLGGLGGGISLLRRRR